MSLGEDSIWRERQLTSGWNIAMPGNAHDIVHETEN